MPLQRGCGHWRIRMRSLLLPGTCSKYRGRVNPFPAASRSVGVTSSRTSEPVSVYVDLAAGLAQSAEL